MLGHIVVTLQKEEGTRRDPPWSLPIPNGIQFPPINPASPALLPPALRAKLKGF